MALVPNSSLRSGEKDKVQDATDAHVATLLERETDLDHRVVRTLDLAARWGFAVEVERLGGMLLGGSADPDEVYDVLARSRDIHVSSGFATLRGYESLVEKSIARRESHTLLNGSAQKIAENYATELVRLCPWVRSVAISGSMATGGFAFGDDLDFDLLVEDETRYLTYLFGMALGALFSLRYRRFRAHPGLLRKLVCLNVIWTASEARPFVRQDDAMAFELSLVRPLIGVSDFADVLRENPSLGRVFPQMLSHSRIDVPRPSPSRLGRRLLRSIVRHPRRRRAIDRAARAASWIGYHGYSMILGPEGRERREFLERAKYPYEVFQD